MPKMNTGVLPVTQDALIQKLLSRKNGDDVMTAQSATGWQPIQSAPR
jgi:hypothetical protein